MNSDNNIDNSSTTSNISGKKRIRNKSSKTVSNKNKKQKIDRSREKKTNASIDSSNIILLVTLKLLNLNCNYLLNQVIQVNFR